MGTGRTAPDVPKLPTPGTSTAAWPCAGQGSCTGVPGTVNAAGIDSRGAAAGTGVAGAGPVSRSPARIAAAPNRHTAAAAPSGQPRRRRGGAAGATRGGAGAVVGIAR